MPLGLAVSGGADSMAMLCLATEALEDIAVVTVDHGLRPEAKDECALVERACKHRDIPCAILKVELGAGNVQQEARRARYAALAGWAQAQGRLHVATAHHADDQAETCLMRLNRGSGIAGLSGIRRRMTFGDSDVTFVRPLIEFRREELRDVLRAVGQDYASDPSNRDRSYERVRFREHLAGADWLDPAAIARSAQHLADADDTLESIVDGMMERDTVAIEGGMDMPWTPWDDINARLVVRCARLVGNEMPLGDARALAARLGTGSDAKGNAGGVLVTRRGNRALCTREPARGARH